MLSVFIVDELPREGEVSIVGDEAHHASAVVRIKEGDELLVTDGRGSSAHVRVLSSTKKIVRCEVLSREMAHANPTKFIVVQALTKGDRARETIELLTEAGVDVIVPWTAQRSVGQWKDDTHSKWQSWAREATKQSRRVWIPEVAQLHSSATVAQLIESHSCALVFHESSAVKLSQLLQGKLHPEVIIIIGPEGGLDEHELDAFVSAGGTVVGMGKPVFRSAHAGAVALAAVQTALGIW